MYIPVGFLYNMDSGPGPQIGPGRAGACLIRTDEAAFWECSIDGKYAVM